MTGSFIQITVTGTQGDKRLPLLGDRLTIGRSPTNDIVLNDDLSSRSHAVIECVSGEYFVRDLGSRNGTLVNGARLATVRQLIDNDVVAIGKHQIKLVLGEPALIEDVEMLTADDLLEDEQESDYSDEPTGDVLPSEFFALEGDIEAQFTKLASNLPSGGFDAPDMELTDSRGQAVHSEAKRGKLAAGDAVGLLRMLLLVTARSHATDIHIEPRQESHMIRLRIDGQLVDIAAVSNPVGLKIGTVVKVLCQIDIAQRKSIQEGAFAARVPDSKSPGKFRRIDYRVSLAPSVLGQKLVVRVLDASGAPSKLSGLGLPKYMLEQVARIIHQDSGMILVCGPTGSGKTTTLYSLLRSIDLAKRNVVTIEDPVEVHLDGITQIPVDEEHGKSFLQLLRSLLRQDPDVILIGEVRDSETARVAMQAAITGHLVFSTVHTRDTLGTIVRMRDLGVEPYVLAEGLQLVIAQRLVRQLCPFCKKPVTPTPRQLTALGPKNAHVRQIFKPVGCPRCLRTGHAGRRAVFELLVSEKKMAEAIIANATPQELGKITTENSQFVSLRQSALQLVADGFVAFEEIEQDMGA